MKTRRALCWIFTLSACTLPGLDPPGPPHITSRQTRTRACSVVADCPNGYTCEPGGARSDGEQEGPACPSLARATRTVPLASPARNGRHARCIAGIDSTSQPEREAKLGRPVSILG